MKTKLIRTALALALALSLSLITAVPAVASDIIVGPTPNYTTIQSAIDAADPYDTLIVQPGVYNEDIDINIPLTIVSEQGCGETAIVGVSTGYTGAVVISSDDVVFGADGQGFTITGTGQGGIYLKAGCDNVTAGGNWVFAANAKNALVTEGGQSNHTFTGNCFAGNASQLVYVNGQASVNTPSSNVDFIDNIFAGTATGPALGQEATDSEISGNTFATPTGWAVLELWGADNDVTGNEFTGDLPEGGRYVLDNTETVDMADVLANNTFLRAVVVDHTEASLLHVIWANIQDAVYETDTGDTVIVQPGTYDEEVYIETESINLCSAIDHEAIIEGSIEIEADGVTVDGFIIEDFDWGWAGPTAISIYYSTDVTVSNNIIDGDAIDLEEDTAFGIFAFSEYDVSATLEGNIIVNVSVGIMSMLNYQLLINENTIDGATICGINVRSNDGTEIIYNDIINNRIGIRVAENGAGVSAHFNNIHGNTDYGILSEGPTVDATNNYWCSPSGPSNSPGSGDKVSGNVLYQPWLLAPVVPGEEPVTFDRTHALYIGWTLVSTDNWIDPNESVGIGVLIAYNYSPSLGYWEATPADLVPVNAVFLKTEDGGVLAINYSGGVPVASVKNLEAGWNLISSATEDYAYPILSPLRFTQVGNEQGICMTTLASQGDLNQFSDSFLLATLTEDDWNELWEVDLIPFDGYWVYLNAAKLFGVVPD